MTNICPRGTVMYILNMTDEVLRGMAIAYRRSKTLRCSRCERGLRMDVALENLTKGEYRRCKMVKTIESLR